MTRAFNFGQFVKRSFYLSPDMLAAGNLGTVTPPKRKKKKKPVDNNEEAEQPNRQPENPRAKSAAYLFGEMLKNANEPTWGQFGYEFAQNFNPWSGRPAGTGTGSYMDKWYNPWTQNKDPMSKGEAGLMRTGQAAMGTAAAAGTLAGGIAAAPTVAGMFGGGAGTTAATTAGGTAAATQTPAGQNLLQRGSQMAGQVMNTAQRGADMYQRNVAPTLERLNYKPEDVLQDTAAVATGNFDKVKGPNWGKGMLPSGLPQGAPSIPRPLETWKSMYGAGAGMLPGTAPASTAMAHAGM
jgi:hypothetical protein